MEENLIKVEIVTPERIVLSERVNEVVVPGEEGEFGVLPQHTPFLTSLRVGIVTVYNEGKQEKLVVGKGFCEVTGKKVIVLTQMAAKGDEIDRTKTEAELNEAEAKLKELEQSEPEYENYKNLYDYSAYKLKLVAS